MTIEEAIARIRHHKIIHKMDEPRAIYISEALDMAIKSLEQTSTLDKIRAEIEQLPINTRTNWNGCCPDNDYPEIEYVDVSKNHLLAIIDKYKIESEEEDE